MQYKLILLDTFNESLGAFNKKDGAKLVEKIHKMLSMNPYRYNMLKGYCTISGVKFVGLHRMKSGLTGGKRGGAYVLYRICKECKENGYYEKSDVYCQFCDEDKDNCVVLFITKPRNLGY